MKVRIDWADGHASTFTNTHPQVNRMDNGDILLLTSKDGKTTREINTDKANYISFTEEPGDQDLLAAQPRYVDGGYLNPTGQPSPYST